MSAYIRSSNHGPEFSTRLGELDSTSMFEDSPEAFISRWQRHAAEVELFPHIEGSPLLECRAGNALLQLFERTGPYVSRPGPQRAIIHPITDALEKLEPGSGPPELTALGISRLEARGTVVVIEDGIVVVDAGAPLVVGVLGDRPIQISVGDFVHFESASPVHGFVVTGHSPYSAHPQRERHDDQF